MNVSLTVLLVRAWVTSRMQHYREQDPERGDVPQWVIVTAIGVAMAIAIGAIIIAKVTDRANRINLQ